MTFVLPWPKIVTARPYLPAATTYPSPEFTVPNRFHGMVIDQLHPILTSIDQYTRTHLVDHSRDSGTVLKHLVYRRLGKYLALCSGRLQDHKISADKMDRNGYVFYMSVNGVWLTKSVPPQYFKRENFEEPVAAAIKSELFAAFRTEEEPEAFVEENMIHKYGWEYVQQWLFRILLDDACTKADYSAASIIYGAVLSDQRIKKKTAIGLLYYRLGDIAAPYDNDRIWSIAANLYCLDFCNFHGRLTCVSLPIFHSFIVQQG